MIIGSQVQIPINAYLKIKIEGKKTLKTYKNMVKL